MEAPLIDPRGYEDLVGETAALATRLSGWQPRDGQPDAGQALIRIFARFAELVVQRLNRAPEKNYLAFLNLIGISPLPPQPARVPLTFRLAEGSPVDAVVPAGAQAAAPPLEGEDDEVVFETERLVVLTRAALRAVYSSDTEADAYSDRTAQATGRADEPFAVFGGEVPTPHQLYLACDVLLVQPGRKEVTLMLASPDTWQWRHWPITWAYWDGAAWRGVNSSGSVEGGAWRVRLSQLPPLTPHAVDGVQAGWLRAQLELRLPPGGAGQAPEAIGIGAKDPQDLAVPLEVFPEASAVKRCYLSADEAFAAAGARAQVRVRLARPGVAKEVQLTWLYQTGDGWLPLGQSSTGADQVGASDFALRDTTLALTRDGELSFQVPMTWPRSLYRTRTGRWLRVDIASGGYTTPPEIAALEVAHDWELPRIRGIAVQVSQPAEADPLPPTSAFANGDALDLSKDFYPFGEQPRFNDTLCIALPDALARPGAAITLSVALTNPEQGSDPVKPVYAAGNPKVAWEVWDGRRWAATGADYAFTAGGDVNLTLPGTLAPVAVNGETRHWLRARLVGGDYGRPVEYTRQSDGTYAPVEAKLAPPVVTSLSFAPLTAPQAAVPASACLSYNDFAYAERTTAAAAVREFTPFAPTADTEPALYLGLDRAPDSRPVSLYLQVEPPRPEEVAADRLAAIDPLALPQITWEYAAPGGWRSLGARDETQALATRGLVEFIGPSDAAVRSCFGQTLYWLRARWQRGAFALPPRLRRVLLNTTWAAQATRVADEILGSSNGDPGQVFTTAQSPVQPGQELLVRERGRPSPAEQEELVAQEGADAVSVILDAAGQPDETWVRWHAVPDFYASGARDRYYTLDALTGELRFGDGSRGMIPPVGRNNLRITYRTGGGEPGNRAAGTIVELKSGVAYIDGVANHEPAQGGAPREPIERLKARGPRVLRHRDRAITAQDLEDLASAASADVARVAAITPVFAPYNLLLGPQETPTAEHGEVAAGRMGVIVVPNADAIRPAPSLGLLRQVQAHLTARCPVTAEVWVAGPEWIAVTVTAAVAPVSLETADALGGRVSAAVTGFLHPLTGGPGGHGWAFGRKPHRSDLFALVEAVEGVDHVRSLAVAYKPETADDDRSRALSRMLEQPLRDSGDRTALDRAQRRWLDRALVYSGRHEISVVFA